MIPAHQFILSCRSDYFRKIFIESSISGRDMPTVDLGSVNIDVFRQMLLYIYCDTCDMLTLGKKLEFSVPVNSSINSSSNSSCNVNNKASPDNCNNVIDVRENEKISAYEVREKQKKKSKKGSKKGAGLNGMTDVSQVVSTGTQSKNPVTRLGDLGRQFGVKSLTKRLEAVKYQGENENYKGL